nr:hypothetical protein Iba_chr15aCG9700 [Ipomoea batatas]
MVELSSTGNTSSLVGCVVKPETRYFLRTLPLCVTSTFTPRRAFLIFTRSESDNGLDDTSFPRS